MSSSSRTNKKTTQKSPSCLQETTSQRARESELETSNYLQRYQLQNTQLFALQRQEKKRLFFIRLSQRGSRSACCSCFRSCTVTELQKNFTHRLLTGLETEERKKQQFKRHRVVVKNQQPANQPAAVWSRGQVAAHACTDCRGGK